MREFLCGTTAVLFCTAVEELEKYKIDMVSIVALGDEMNRNRTMEMVVPVVGQHDVLPRAMRSNIRRHSTIPKNGGITRVPEAKRPTENEPYLVVPVHFLGASSKRVSLAPFSYVVLLRSSYWTFLNIDIEACDGQLHHVGKKAVGRE